MDINSPLDSLVLQRFIVDRPAHLIGLYWRVTDPATGAAEPDGARLEGGVLILQPHLTLSFDTYFNAFFGSFWRRHTRLATLTLRLRVDAACRLRVISRTPTGRHLLCQQVIPAGETRINLPDHATNFRQHGLIAVEITAADTAVGFLDAAWIAPDAAPEPVALTAIVCSFDREPELGRLLASLAADTGLTARLAAITVVSQGRPGLAAAPAIAAAAARLGDCLRIIEQPNLGGAGGFGRGILEALDDGRSTHVVLLDDDIAVEPDGLFRMAAFFALVRAPLLLGGHMLDAVHPTTLYEAGAVITDRHWAFQPQHHTQDLLNPDVLVTLTQPVALHYNGWWCCGIPLSVVRQHGMPLPVFIRGDDLEFGLRLHERGVPTIALPGAAVWHEPFYLKIGSWHLYYETRNILIAMSLNQPISQWEVVRRMGRHLVMSLLTFRYYNAALILRGIADYLAGPATLHADPGIAHASLKALRDRFPAAKTPRTRVLSPQILPAAPRRPIGYLLRLARLLLFNMIRPTRASPARLLQVRDLAWPVMTGVDHIAVETWWDEALPTFQRCRASFNALAAQSAMLLLRLYRQAPAVAAQWRAAQPELTGTEFWRLYVAGGMTALPHTPGAVEPGDFGYGTRVSSVSGTAAIKLRQDCRAARSSGVP